VSHVFLVVTFVVSGLAEDEIAVEFPGLVEPIGSQVSGATLFIGQQSDRLAELGLEQLAEAGLLLRFRLARIRRRRRTC